MILRFISECYSYCTILLCCLLCRIIMRWWASDDHQNNLRVLYLLHCILLFIVWDSDGEQAMIIRITSECYTCCTILFCCFLCRIITSQWTRPARTSRSASSRPCWCGCPPPSCWACLPLHALQLALTPTLYSLRYKTPFNTFKIVSTTLQVPSCM